jgi:2-polyprenyl-6-methoxyphenol hydroxylase-like FAD-dependent oxidoreductase
MSENKAKMRHIAIVGGGTAGWMAAALFAKRWTQRDIKISVIESQKIGIVGVGEGSTPQLKAFFDTLHISEQEWMPACNATYKMGIRFNNWSHLPGGESYFHPFASTLDKHVAQAFVYNNYLRRQGFDVATHPNRYFVQAKLAQEGMAPHPKPHFPFPVQYGYHFDSYLLGQFLKEKTLEWGVEHRYATINKVTQHANGDIASLVAEEQKEIHADMFIDCSGFDGLLIQKTLNVPFTSFADNLFNNAAVVLPTQREPVLKAQTISKALKYGWRWQIPLTTRTGNGYVYSNVYCGADQAETELRKELGLLDSDVEARHLNMKVGQVAQHWSHNCLALGLSQGFIEPLEATALHLVQTTVESFMQYCERGDFTSFYQQQFNALITQRFEGVRDYIVCHFKANGRDDTEYWVDNRNNTKVSDSLTQMLNVWQRGGDLTEEIQRQNIGHYYNPISWHCLLSGYSQFNHRQPLHSLPVEKQKFSVNAIDDFTQRCAMNFPLHEEQLTQTPHVVSG